MRTGGSYLDVPKCYVPRGTIFMFNDRDRLLTRLGLLEKRR